jgi:hypothetical protein
MAVTVIFTADIVCMSRCMGSPLAIKMPTYVDPKRGFITTSFIDRLEFQ